MNALTRLDLAQMFYEVSQCLRYTDQMIKLPDCNTCKKGNCEYRPGWGEPVRVNCFMWEGDTDE